MPQVPAAAAAIPAPCLPKSVTELLVDAHVRRHRAALSLGGLRGCSCAWLECLCLVLAAKLTGDCKRGLWWLPAARRWLATRDRCHMCTFRNGPSKPPWDIPPS